MNSIGERAPVVLVVNSQSRMHRAVCDRISAAYPDLDVRSALSPDDALMLLEQEHIDVVIVADDSAATGLQQIRAVLEGSPESSIIVVSNAADSAAPADETSAGALRFVSTQARSSTLTAQLAKLLCPAFSNGAHSFEGS